MSLLLIGVRVTLGLRKVMVRAHRQAWCWQDEWYGLTMEDIRQLELETQLALARKMAQFSQAEEATEANGGTPSPDKDQEAKEAISSIEAEEVVVSSGAETLQPRGILTKQWSTSSRSSRSSKRGGEEHTIFVCPPACMAVCEGDTGGFPGLVSQFSSFLAVVSHILLHYTISCVFTRQQALKAYFERHLTRPFNLKG